MSSFTRPFLRNKWHHEGFVPVIAESGVWSICLDREIWRTAGRFPHTSGSHIHNGSNSTIANVSTFPHLKSNPIHQSINPYRLSSIYHYIRIINMINLLTNRITTSGSRRSLSCKCQTEVICMWRQSQPFQRLTALVGGHYYCTPR